MGWMVGSDGMEGMEVMG